MLIHFCFINSTHKAVEYITRNQNILHKEWNNILCMQRRQKLRKNKCLITVRRAIRAFDWLRDVLHVTQSS